jgi:DNA-binding transcriptional LysR family regulator
MNLHQMRIFCAIAQSKTLTQAAKQIGLTQPTLSQQLSSLEEKVGTKLFDRTLNQMELTVAGEFLLRRAILILNEVEGMEGQLREFATGKRGIIRLAGINSIIRAVAPEAIRLLKQRLPEVEFDMHELSPTEVLELLYARQINIGLVAVGSLPKSNVSFKEFPVVTDPYVLVTPSGLGLAGVVDLDADLSPEKR